MSFFSTRNKELRVTGAHAILQGLAQDGGLFVPEHVPTLEDLRMTLSDLKDLNYQQVAAKVIGGFFDDFTEEEIEYCVHSAYDCNFYHKDVVNCEKVSGTCLLELFHGRTGAFKDMALSILPYLMEVAIKKTGETKTIRILTATSGDTGKAALAGFAGVPGTEIAVYYPKDGVSKTQYLQMATQEGENARVYAINGNFDQAQSGVKEIFADEAVKEALLKDGIVLSSANSINIGRLVPQVAYYVYGYGQMIKMNMIKPGESIDVAVPTGNFGNILAAYYAKEMGVPIDRFVCCSNENKVLTEFFQTGKYDKLRPFKVTNSPSMDILISSNLERLIYHKVGAERTKQLMTQLNTSGCYELDNKEFDKFCEFVGGFASEKETSEEIRRVFEEENYLLDTHTAVALQVVKTMEENGIIGDHKVLVASTASPYKFSKDVGLAIGIDPSEVADEVQWTNKLMEVSKTTVHPALKDLENKEILHTKAIEVDQIKNMVNKKEMVASN